MGVLYSAIPLSEFQAPGGIDYLEEHGVHADVFGTPSRYPTRREIRSVLDSLAGYKVEYEPDGSADIVDAVKGYEGMSASLQIITKDNEPSDDDTPCFHFYFSKGWAELNLEILKRLSIICGPFICMDDSSCVPVLVEPDTDPEIVWRAWYPELYEKSERTHEKQ
jgi:hypothetical protein